MKTRLLVFLSVVLICAPLHAQVMPKPEPIPDLPAPKPPGSVALGDPKNFPEVKLTFPIADGPYEPTWDSVAQNYPSKEQAWLRDAKFG
ncbi:MAG: alpha-L-fucosidase, partial [Tepidisphaeraceae bacterium]